MSETLTREQWRSIEEQLKAPFDPRDVDFRAQSQGKGKASGKVQALAYVDARAVQDRLDASVGVGGWSFTWEPVVVANGEVQVAQGTITIHGISKSDAGDASTFAASLGAVSHAFKRAAVHWGIGRYLYDLPSPWVEVDQYGRIPPETLNRLRAGLPKPGAPVNASQRTQEPRQPVVPAAQAQQHPATAQRPPAAQERVTGPHAVVPAAGSGNGVFGEDRPVTDAQVAALHRLATMVGEAVPQPKTFAEAAQEMQRLNERQREMRSAGAGEAMESAVMRGTRPN